MYCLDTNVIIDIFRGDASLKSKLEKMYETFDIFVTTTSLCELYRGAYGHTKSEEKLKMLEQFISSFNIVSLDKDSCRVFGESYKKLAKTGSATKDFDLMIASIVKTNDFILVTRDKKHFENLGINIEIW
ncbi:MAG: type II toxin-antitoxin system VapC family toxin [Nanoarchaeota archaeon]